LTSVEAEPLNRHFQAEPDNEVKFAALLPLQPLAAALVESVPVLPALMLVFWLLADPPSPEFAEPQW